MEWGCLLGLQSLNIRIVNLFRCRPIRVGLLIDRKNEEGLGSFIIFLKYLIVRNMDDRSIYIYMK